MTNPGEWLENLLNIHKVKMYTIKKTNIRSEKNAFKYHKYAFKMYKIVKYARIMLKLQNMQKNKNHRIVRS